MFFKKKLSHTGVSAIIVGLGNPGKQYENTRHNVGFYVIDKICEQSITNEKKNKFNSNCIYTTICEQKVLLLKPRTFMNNSGTAVKEAMSFYKIPPEKTIIIFDDISLPPGKIRIRRSGSAGGHNGMKNIIALSSQNTFPRIKIGIGEKPNPRWDLANWVLSCFTQDEIPIIDTAASKACDALKFILCDNIVEAMNRYN